MNLKFLCFFSLLSHEKLRSLKYIWLISAYIGYMPMVQADTINIMSGRGVVGVFGSYTSSLVGSTQAYGPFPEGSKGEPFAYIEMNFWFNGAITTCYTSMLMNIDGVYGIPLVGTPDLMITPEVVYTDNRSWTSPSAGGDIVHGYFNGYGSATNEQLGGSRDKCIWEPYQSTPVPSFTWIAHNAVVTGRLLVYGTGNQTSGTYTLKDNIVMALRDTRLIKEVTWANKGNYTFKISDLGCVLTTPVVIDFGAQPANATNGEFLAKKSDGNLAVNCQQSTNPMSATLSLSAGINPIYFSGDDYQVNLINSENKAGAYVTMSLEINGTPTNIPFNRTPVDIGTIDASHSGKSFDYPITYSLYSRGTGITGKVKGSAELSIVLR